MKGKEAKSSESPTIPHSHAPVCEGTPLTLRPFPPLRSFPPTNLVSPRPAYLPHPPPNSQNSFAHTSTSIFTNHSSDQNRRRGAKRARPRRAPVRRTARSAGGQGRLARACGLQADGRGVGRCALALAACGEGSGGRLLVPDFRRLRVGQTEAEAGGHRPVIWRFSGRGVWLSLGVGGEEGWRSWARPGASSGRSEAGPAH